MQSIVAFQDDKRSRIPFASAYIVKYLFDARLLKPLFVIEFYLSFLLFITKVQNFSGLILLLKLSFGPCSNSSKPPKHFELHLYLPTLSLPCTKFQRLSNFTPLNFQLSLNRHLMACVLLCALLPVLTEQTIYLKN